jgi:hypothetical protein
MEVKMAYKKIIWSQRNKYAYFSAINTFCLSKNSSCTRIFRFKVTGTVNLAQHIQDPGASFPFAECNVVYITKTVLCQQKLGYKQHFA